MQVQKLFIDARQAGNAGRYEECKKKLIEAHRLELWNTRITVDLAEIEFALQRFLDAVSNPFTHLSVAYSL